MTWASRRGHAVSAMVAHKRTKVTQNKYFLSYIRPYVTLFCSYFFALQWRKKLNRICSTIRLPCLRSAHIVADTPRHALSPMVYRPRPRYIWAHAFRKYSTVAHCAYIAQPLGSIPKRATSICLSALTRAFSI